MTNRLSGALAARLGLGAVIALSALTLTARPAQAYVNGGCTATGYESATNTSAKDLSKSGATGFHIDQGDSWHVHKGSYISGSGSSGTVKQTFAKVNVDVFGFPVPIVDAKGDGGFGGDAGPFAVDDFSKYTKTIDVTGSSDTCSGGLTITVDDQSPAATVAGAAALALTALGGLGTVGVALRRR